MKETIVVGKAALATGANAALLIKTHPSIHLEELHKG